MTFLRTLRFSSSNIAALKKSLREKHPYIGSSHADEALAASFGFNSYAAMLALLRHVGDTTRVMIGLDYFLLAIRLNELGYPNISVSDLGRFVWKTEFPVAPYDESTEQAVKLIKVPKAANSS